MESKNLEGISTMAKRLGVPVSWLYSRTRTGEIPHIKLGKYVRFDVEDVTRWLDDKKVSAKS